MTSNYLSKQHLFVPFPEQKEHVLGSIYFCEAEPWRSGGWPTENKPIVKY
jgi:hypothetical protein